MEASTLIEAFRVDGKVAVVTGAGSGIGRASALALGGAGATVICADIHPDTPRPTPRPKSKRGRWNRRGVGLDVSARTDVDALAERVVAERGGIQIWCNIAGIMLGGPFLDETESDLDRIMAVNLKGVFFGCQAAGRVMVKQPEGGSIINTSSAAADTPSPNIVSYAISQGGREPDDQDARRRDRQGTRPSECGGSRIRHHRHDHRILLTSRRQRRRGDAEQARLRHEQRCPVAIRRRARGHRGRRALPRVGRVPVHDRAGCCARTVAWRWSDRTTGLEPRTHAPVPGSVS